jgi:hypothetical protein
MSVTLGTLAASSAATAQTDYFNTDAGRPLTIEDAYPVERRALEIQLAPTFLERVGPGHYRGEIEPQIAYGVLLGTQLELGFPVAFAEGAGRPLRARLTGMELSLLHNLNAETSIPAFAIEGSTLVPIGDQSLRRAVFSAKAIATRTFSAARMHANAQYTFGGEDVVRDDSREPELTPHLSRWVAGIAIDRAIPLRSVLLGVEVVATQPIHRDSDLRWTFGGGWRYQFTPRIALDAGVGRHVTGEGQGWYVTSGSAFAVGLPWWPR